MTCDHLQTLIEDYIDQQLDNKERAMLEEHLTYCDCCQATKAASLEYRKQLQAFKAPKLSPDSAARLLRNARTKNEHHQQTKSSFVYGFAAASILAFAIMISSSMFTETPPPGIVGVLDWEKEISLVINVPNDMSGAKLVLNLPSDISIQGLEHLSTVEWMINLKKGSNTITLPIQVEPYASYAENVQLAASLIYKNDKKDFSLDLTFGSQNNKDKRS